MHGDCKLIAFDVDGTLIEAELWGRLNAVLDVPKERGREIFHEYLHGQVDYRTCISNLAHLWVQSGKRKEDILSVLHDFKLVPHAETTVAYLKNSYHLALISSGFDLYVAEVAERLSVPHAYFYGTFMFNETEQLVDINFLSERTEIEAKVDAIKDLQKRYRLEPNEIMFVGDSKNDIGAFEYTGRGVLIGEGNEDLRRNAWKQINSLDEIKNFA